MVWKQVSILASTLVLVWGVGVGVAVGQVQIMADFDASGAVDFQDFSRLVAGFGKTSGSVDFDSAVDLNGDGSVDGEDAFLFADVFTSRAPQAQLNVDSGPNGGASVHLEPAGNGFLISLQGAVQIGGYRIALTVPDTVSVDVVEDRLKMGLLPVRQTASGVEVVGLVLGTQSLIREGKTLLAGITFNGDTTGVAVEEVVLRGNRISFATDNFRGQRNSLSASQIEKVPLGDIELDRHFLDFGDVTLGESRDLSFRLTNTFDEQQRFGASRPLAFEIEPMDNQVSVSPRAFGVLEDSTTGLASDASQTIQVTFIPTVTGPFSSLVKVRTNRSEREGVEVVVQAQVFAPGEGRQVRAFADFDSSETVDWEDLTELVSRFGAVPDSAKFDLDGDGVIGGEDAFLFADLIGGRTGRASFDAVTLVDGVNGAVGVRAQGSGEEMTISVRDLQRMGGYRILLEFETEEVDVRWAQDLAGGGLLPVHKTAGGAEIVGLGVGARISTVEDMGLARIRLRSFKGEPDVVSLVTVTGAVFRGDRGERDSVEVIQIGTAGLDASPRVLDFGNVRLGGVRQLQFKIFNLNSTAISFEIASTDTQVTTRPRSVGNLGPGKVWEVTATFSPALPGPFSSLLSITTVDSDVDPVDIQVRGVGAVVSVAPDSLRFGDVFLGQERTLQVTVTNPNVAPFTIEDLAFTGEDAGFSLVDPPVLPVQVAGEGGAQVLDVLFLPLSRDPVQVALQIVGMDTTLGVSLAGRGVEFSAEVSADTLGFGGVTVEDDTTFFVTVFNAGNIPFVVDSLTFVVGDTSFSLASSPELPDTIEVDGIDTLAVRFLPDTAGAHVDTLRIVGSDTTRTVALSGTGLPKEVEVSEDVLTVTLGGTVTLSRNLLHFGNVPFGESGNLKLRIENRRGGSLSFEVSPTDFQVTVKPGSVENLLPNRDRDVVVTFTPVDQIQTNSRLRISTNDPADGVIEIQVKTGGSLPILSPTAVDFGQIGVGRVFVQNLTLRNLGNSNFVVSALSVVSGDSSFVLVSPPRLPFAIDAEGGEKAFDLRFQPGQRGVFGDTLRFVGTDTSVVVPMSGIGRESALTVVPDSLAFELVRVGEDRSLELQIVNAGRDTVVMLEAGFVGAGLPFSSVSFPVLPDTLLPEGGERTLTVRFAPDAAGGYGDTFRIVDAVDTLNIPVSGTGTVAEAVVSNMALNFGTLAVGRERIQLLTVTNTGNIPFGISEAVLLQGDIGFSLVDPPALPDSLAVDTDLSLEVRFAPGTTGAAADTLRLVGQDTTLEVRLSGVGDPSLTVVFGETTTLSAEALDFGDLRAGESGKRILRIVNEGAAPLTFATETEEEGVAARPGSLSDLPQNQNWDVVVIWEPIESSPFLQVLRVSVGDEVVEVPVGRGEVFASVAPESLAFGEVRVGEETELRLTLHNRGLGAFVLQTVSKGTDTGFVLASAPALPDTIGGGDSLRVQVRFAPGVRGEAADTLRLVGRDTAWAVPISGRGIQAVVELSPEALEFGDVVALTDSSLTLRMTNSGNGDFVVENIQLASADTAFSLTSTPTLPATLVADGGTDTVRVTLRPGDLGAYADTLLISGMGEVLKVPLSGESTETAVIATSVVVTFSSGVNLEGDLLSFGDIPEGTTRRLGFTFRNRRDTTVTYTIESTNTQVTVQPTSAQVLAFQERDVAVSFTPVELGLASGVLKITTTSPEDGTTEIRVGKTEPPVRVLPSTLAFGEVAVGEEHTEEVTIANPRIFNFRVQSLEFAQADPAFLVISPPALPDTVSPEGGTRTLRIGFRPGQSGAFRDTLKIVGADATLTVALSGTGTKPVAGLVPPALDFGTLEIGQDSLRSLTVTNSGNGLLILDRLRFGREDSAYVLVGPPALPDSIGPDESRSLTLRFLPREAGPFPDTLQIAGPDTVLRVPLAGAGKAPASTAPGPIALDLDLSPGDQGKRQGEAARGRASVDLAATEGTLGIAGFEVVLTFNPAQLQFDAFSATDLFEAGAAITTPGEGRVQLSVAFLGAVSAERDSGSLGEARFLFQEDFSGEAEVSLVSAQYATSAGLEVLEIGSEGASVVIDGAGTVEPNPDFDGDGDVGFSDFLLFAQRFGAREGDEQYGAGFDLDSSGDIGFGDFLLFAQAFGTTTGGSKPAGVAKPTLQ